MNLHLVAPLCVFHLVLQRLSLQIPPTLSLISQENKPSFSAWSWLTLPRKGFSSTISFISTSLICTSPQKGLPLPNALLTFELSLTSSHNTLVGSIMLPRINRKIGRNHDHVVKERCSLEPKAPLFLLQLLEYLFQ